MITSATQIPGGTIVHHAPREIAVRSYACSMIEPHDTALGSDNPRNASAVSSKIATATVRTTFATSRGAICGSTWFARILVLLAPSERARFTYARSRTLFTCARTILAVLVHNRIPITTMMWNRLGPQ